MRIVFAVWILEELPASLDEFHISCGEDDEDQQDGFFPSDNGARLTIICRDDGTKYKYARYKVHLEVPDRRGITAKRGHWLSPNPINEKHEAASFGSRKGTR